MQNMGDQQDFRALDRSLRIQKIIDTAVELFHKKGYRTTTLDDVSRELGVTKAALYHYVSSKENLLSIIYIQALENIFRNTDKISGMDLPPNEKLRLIIRNHVKDIIIQSLSMLSVFFSEENQLPEKDFRKIQEEKKKYNRILEKIIEEGISQGLFRKADPRLQAYGILGMCNWVYKWYKPGNAFYKPDQIAEHFIGLLERGYLRGNREEDDLGLKPFEIDNKKTKSGVEKVTLQELRDQCQALIDLIDEMDNNSS
jgi:AcrR family transcriptional regulator